MKLIFKLCLCVILCFGVTSLVFSKGLLKDGYEFDKYKSINGKVAYDYTIDEASELSKSGNPLDFAIEYKMECDGNFTDITYHNEEDEWGNPPQILVDLAKIKRMVRENVQSESIPLLVNDSEKKIYTSIPLISIVFFVALLFMVVILFALNKKKYVVTILIILIVFSIFNIIIYNNNNIKQGRFKSIERFIMLDEMDEHICADVNKPIKKENTLKYYNNKWDVSQIINDYLSKISICMQHANEDSKKIEDIYPKNDEVMNAGNYAFFEDLPMAKYLNNVSCEDILKSFMNYADLMKLSRNVSTFEKIDVSDELKRIIQFKSIDDVDKDEYLFEYLKRISDPIYLNMELEFFDFKTILEYKDWYIEGVNDIRIELPYGAIINYESPKFVKKDIREVLYTNEQELDFDSKDKQVLIVYYKDSSGKMNGTYTDIELVKTGEDYIIDFNPYELLYDIKKPTVKLVVK